MTLCRSKLGTQQVSKNGLAFPLFEPLYPKVQVPENKVAVIVVEKYVTSNTCSEKGIGVYVLLGC